jgi:hypothetical protein
VNDDTAGEVSNRIIEDCVSIDEGEYTNMYQGQLQILGDRLTERVRSRMCFMLCSSLGGGGIIYPIADIEILLQQFISVQWIRVLTSNIQVTVKCLFCKLFCSHPYQRSMNLGHVDTSLRLLVSAFVPGSQKSGALKR